MNRHFVRLVFTIVLFIVALQVTAKKTKNISIVTTEGSRGRKVYVLWIRPA